LSSVVAISTGFYEGNDLLPSAARADTAGVRPFVAFVICVALAVQAGAAGAAPPTALRQAESLSGLEAHRAIRTITEPSARFNVDVVRALDRGYPRSLQRLDDRLYVGLGLLPPDRSARARLLAAAASVNAQYDPVARVLRVRRKPAPKRAELVHELVRALVDQNVGLRRLATLRPRDRDASLAANAVVDGLASLASGRRAPALRGAPLDRFLTLERTAGLGPGRTFIAQLRSIGGSFAVSTALRTFPKTTEQMLHVDKFLDREGALSVALAPRVDDRALHTSETLSASETFGELDVRALLRAFDLPGAERASAGWAGGRLALYVGADSAATVALVLRWDTLEQAQAWRTLAPRLVAAAFPGAEERVCPAVDHCWASGAREIASAGTGDLTVLASGTAGELVAATLAR
jgi:hypothetical protein